MTKLKILRLSNKYTQLELERISNIKRWRLALAESGQLRLSDHELQVLGELFKTKPNLLLRSSLLTQKGA